MNAESIDNAVPARPDGERLGLSVVMLTLLAMGIGLVLVYSITASRPLVDETGANLRHPFLMQAGYVVVSLTAILVVARIPYPKLARFAPWILIAALLMLLALRLPGFAREIKGATRWFRFGPVGVQPSEFAKVALVLFFAWFLSRGADPLRSFLRGFVPAGATLALIVALVAMQPDFGTSLFLAATGGFLMLLAGARVLHFGPAVLAAGVPFAGYMVSRFDHIRSRIEGFRDPLAHYNTEHSLLALGTGGWFGRGLGNGREKLDYLPESSSDFIFSILGEELGFVGAGLLALLYVAFLWQGARIAMRSEDTLGFYLAAGATFLVALQALIHIAVATASVPTKGIPLPFVSVGGSNLLSLSIGVGMLASVARGRRGT